MWWKALVFVIISVGIAMFEIPRLKQKNYKKEIKVFYVLLILATIVNIIDALKLIDLSSFVFGT